MTKRVHVIGGGLAGSEAVWQCLKAGFHVVLHEMRPKKLTPAHHTGMLAELVCSNSLKSESPESAPGQLKAEMEALDSLIIKAAKKAKVPAGQALAVDREQFSADITQSLEQYPGFERRDEEVGAEQIASDPDAIWLIATGPLSSEPMSQFLTELSGGAGRLYFYDAIAPVIETDSLDLSQLFRASRYEDGDGDYLNIPLDKEQYLSFIEDVKNAEKMPLHAFEETKYFESCLPIEVMIERGADTLRFGPMKPVGLTDPKTGMRPYANIQLRMENRDGTMVSMVGFQTKMKWPEQARVLRKLPGFAEAEFYRFGSVHRNTYLQSPKLLAADFSFREHPNLFLAGQITGVEGYTESAAIGLLAGRAIVARLQNKSFDLPPRTTLLGALANYVLEGGLGDYQPMNANFGLLPRLPPQRGMRKAQRKAKHCERAREDFASFLQRIPVEGSPVPHV
ncbi:MAG: methylenetetrahydrofolate--tRNA-(uracil(54)-C(5))-methyltransferase (FADH(2)-oxidizing) TrmFO [Oligoflexus sp.]